MNLRRVSSVMVSFISGAAVALAAMPSSTTIAAQQVAGAPDRPSMSVTLLGTGTPNPRLERMGPATLVDAGGQRLLFDVGRGTTIRLVQANVPAASLTAVFLTHLHSDHVIGLPDLWLTAWLPPLGGRATALRVFGPTGTRAMAQGLGTAFAEDIRMRTAEERLPPAGVRLEATDVGPGQVVFEQGGVRVTAFAVDHGGELRPAYGYRVTYGGRTLVISGDTKASAELARQARQSDLLLHEVFAAAPDVRDDPSVRFRAEHHTSPAEAARIFAQASPRLAVFTHVALAAGRDGRPPAVDGILSDVASIYKGRVEMGEDLMRIEIGDEVVVHRPSPAARSK